MYTHLDRRVLWFAAVVVMATFVAFGVGAAGKVTTAQAWTVFKLNGSCTGVTALVSMEEGAWHIKETQLDAQKVTFETDFTSNGANQHPFPLVVTDYSTNHQVLVEVYNAANKSDGYTKTVIDVGPWCKQQAGPPGKSYGCDGKVVDATHPPATCPGSTGPKGDKGDTGATGPRGHRGRRGPAGKCKKAQCVCKSKKTPTPHTTSVPR